MQKILESKIVELIIIVLLTVAIYKCPISSKKMESYSNNKLNQNNVSSNLLSELNVNYRLGKTDITSIGDGTLTGAVNTINLATPNFTSILSSLKNSKLDNRMIRMENMNFNSLAENNLLFVTTGGGTNTPAGTSSAWWSVITIPFDNNAQYAVQFAFVIHSSDMYIRYCSGGSWSSWRYI